MPSRGKSDYEDFDFPDFAQEFLRRNKAYQTQFSRLRGPKSDYAASLSDNEVAKSWGLEFRVCSAFNGNRASRNLERIDYTLRHHSV